MTSTDYIGIGVLMTTFFSGIIQVINAIRLKDIHHLVDGQATAQQTLIAALRNKVDDKNAQIADAKQTAAVLAEGQKP